MNNVKGQLIEFHKILSEYTNENIDKSFVNYLNSLKQKEIESAVETSKKINITFKLITQQDERKIDKEIEGMQKLKKTSSDGTIRLKHTILSMNGNYDIKEVRDFIENNMLARDARALRQYITEVQPGIDMEIDVEFKDGYIESNVNLPINLSFFWPDSGI